MVFKHTLALIMGLFMLASLQAQESPSNETSSDMGEMVVTASRGERSADTVAADIEILDAEDIARSNANNLPNLLREVAGVHVFDFLNNGATANVGIGGFGETGTLNTVVLVDGVRIDYSDLAGVDWTSIPLNQVERIEILRGGNSALYGNGATGGVINIFTKGGGENRLTVEGVVHSWGYREKTSASGTVGDLSYNLTQGYEDGEGYRTNNYYRSNNVHLGLTFLPQEAPYELRLRAGHNEEDYGLPGALTLMQLEGRYDYDDSVETENWGARTTSYVTFAPAFILAEDHRFELPVTYRERYAESFFDYGAFGTYETEARDIAWGVAPQYTGTFDLGEMSNTLTLGFEHYTNQKHNIENSLEGTRKTSDIFVHNSLELVENFFLDLGYRYGQADFAFDGFEDVDFDMEAFQAGLTFNYQPRSKVFVSYDQSYRVGVLDEYIVYPSFPAPPFVNDDLDPQISRTWQTGIKHAFGEPLVIGITGFYTDTKDEIFLDPNDTTFSAFGLNNRNYDETRRYGVVTELEARPTEWLDFYASHTWTDARFGEDDTVNYDGNRVPMVPEHVVRAGTQMRFCDFTWDFGGRWVDNQYMISDWRNNGNELDSFFVLDTKLSYTWECLTLFAGVNNLTDEEYAEAGVRGTSVYPSPGRNVFGGFELAVTY